MLSTDVFRDNLSRVTERMSASAIRVGRNPDELVLIGVTKRKPAEDLLTATANGLAHIGENRIQEVRDKLPGLDLHGAQRHFIGHLQSNKVRYLPGLVDVLHSVDSLTLAEKISQRYVSEGLRLPVFLQVNISGEESKSGVEPDELSQLTGACLAMPGLQVLGFMTIGPLTEEQSAIRRSFRSMQQLVEQQMQEYSPELKQARTSMGMSADFEIAIEEGATHIRVGTALFGPRT